MKVCLDYNQISTYLEKADEIRVPYNRYNHIDSLIEKYPNATIILLHNKLDEPINWDNIRTWNILTKNKFILALDSIEECQQAKEHGIKFFHTTFCNSFYQLQALKDLGVCYVYLDAPLFFELDKVKAYGVPVRAVPNLAQIDSLPREDGVLGTWIRPEDIEAYEEYVDAIEFIISIFDDEEHFRSKERALFRIYVERKEWPGELGMIIDHLNYLGLNRLINPETSRKRMNCGQRCLNGVNCHICYRMLDLANEELLKAYRDEIIPN